MRVLFFSNLLFVFVALISVLYGNPFHNQDTGDKSSNMTKHVNYGNGHGFSFNKTSHGLSRLARRKRDFQHGFNKK